MVLPYTLLLWKPRVKMLTYLLLAWNQYACRKTLADSRPRIRGRFARNDEIDKNTSIQWSQNGGDEEEEEDENWFTILDSLVAANFGQESQGSCSSHGVFY